MVKHETPSNGQIIKVATSILTALPKALIGLDIKKVIKAVSEGEKLERALKLMFQSLIGEKEEIKQSEQKEEILDFTYTRTSGLITLNIPKGMTSQKAYEMLKDLGEKTTGKKFGVWKYADNSLDEAVPTNDRYPIEAGYSISFNDFLEADEALKNISANKLNEFKKDGRMFITLFERLLLEWVYFTETGEHLDVDNITLCAGSRNKDGNVPNVNFNDGKVNVNYNNTDNYNDNLRAREVVSDNTQYRVHVIDSVFYFKDCIQPLVIFDISWRRYSKFI